MDERTVWEQGRDPRQDRSLELSNYAVARVGNFQPAEALHACYTRQRIRG